MEDRGNNKWSLVKVIIQDCEKRVEQQDESLDDMTRQTPVFLFHGNLLYFCETERVAKLK